MKVERYSLYGFKPQVQTYHLKQCVWFHLCEFENAMENYALTEFLMKEHERLYNFYKENYQDFTEGVWIFKEGYKGNQALNHLKQKVPKWIAELPDDIDVYDCNWSKKTRLDEYQPLSFGCYVPKRCLKDIKNIVKCS